MTLWREHAHVIDGDGFRLDSVKVSSSYTRTQKDRIGVRVRAGVMNGDAVDWVGDWNQQTSRIRAGIPIEILDTINKPLVDGDTLLIEVSDSGDQESLDGLSVTFRTGRTDLSGGPLLHAASEIEDDRTREVISSVVRQINALGSNVDSHTVRIVKRA
jgi:hypothetical protein